VKPADIARIITLGPPTLAPDGRRAVVAASRVDLVENEYRSALWIVDTDGGALPRQLTHGHHDSAPAWSPDGRWIAFLRAEGEGKSQLHLLAADGGDARSLTDLPLGSGAPTWSPDSSAIAFAARVPEPDRYGQTTSVPPEKEPPRRITGLQYREDGIGFYNDRRSHVFVIDITADRPKATQVTDGDWDDRHVAWHPDGTQLAFLSSRHDGREHDRCSDAFVVGPDGSGLRQITDTSLSLEGLAYGPGGHTLLALGCESGADPADSWLARSNSLWLVDAEASAPVAGVRLTDELTTNVSCEHIVLDGDHALVGVENRGAVDLVAVALDGDGDHATLPAVTVRSAGLRQITAFACAGGVTVATLADPTTGGELARIDADGSPAVLTDFGADIAPTLVPITEVTATAPDGYPVHGFLAVPPGDGPHPVLLMIHGGPFAQYGWTLLDEAQVYAAAGYAVVYGNPRGSSGYGFEHGRYILGDVGEKQAPDVLALLDHVLERPDFDPTRVGVLGGSHGGYMTTWLIGHTDRFGAAVSERAVNAIDSFEGSSDIGWDFADNLYGLDPEQRRRQSPLTYAESISTPLLIIHSEHDWRCPIEQAQRLYVAIRKRSTDVEMLLFPGEGHELSRSGVPSHRIARFEAIVDWFDRQLRPST
jgi:dipeptidyl aminopeptidase/acylaminoacyl peptidase